METYSIGALAKAAGVPTSTVRFYERNGILKPDFRTAGNYRGYGEQALRRLRFIRFALGSGFSLKDIHELLALEDSEQPPCDEVLTLVRNRLQEVRRRLKELQHVEKVLAKALRQCCRGEGPDLCEQVVRLGRQGGVARAGTKN
jgi:MerR family mercuric resistance operon transcriptional regulator